MRKAKEIAEYMESLKGTFETEEEISKMLENILIEFLLDAKELIEKRNIDIEKNLRAFFNCFKETNQRWNALAKLQPILKEDGFKNYLFEARDLKPFMFRFYWNRY